MIAYQQDQRRLISAVPIENIEGMVVLAEVYDSEGVFIGIANAVKPEPETASVVMTIQNGSVEPVDITVNILGKMRYEHSELYTPITSEIITAKVDQGKEYVINFNMLDYDDIKVETSGWANYVHLLSQKIEKSQFTSLDGIVVGGDGLVQVTVPCDFRFLKPGEYVLLFNVESYGIIGEDVLVIKDLSDVI